MNPTAETLRDANSSSQLSNIAEASNAIEAARGSSTASIANTRVFPIHQARNNVNKLLSSLTELERPLAPCGSWCKAQQCPMPRERDAESEDLK